MEESDISELVRALLDPAAYPDKCDGVTMMQTQMSLVFLVGEFVYKLKKPVDLGYLDYTTLQKRKFYCEREVELNRRLAPEAYIGVMEVNQDKDRIAVDGRGNTIEYAVKMRYLPQDRMLDVLLRNNAVTPEMIRGVAAKMAAFHKEAATNAIISDFGDLDVIITNAEENFTQTIKYIGKTIPQKTYRKIKDYTNNFIDTYASLFLKRKDDGRIRDCHGDLHAQHVCFTDDIQIYDCIEFNDRFRYCDVASEIAFLAMDLDNSGRQDLSGIFVDAYVEYSGDDDLPALLNFYKCYRAYVRGKVEGFKLDDALISDEEKTGIQAAASKYFELAESYI